MTESKTLRKTDATDDRPFFYKLASRYALIFAGLFIVYGGVSVVLGFLDRKYDDLADPIMILLYGLVLLAPALAFRERKIWGYWGLVIVNVVVVVNSAVDYSHYENLILLVLSLAALSTLFAPSTKQYLSSGR